MIRVMKRKTCSTRRAARCTSLRSRSLVGSVRAIFFCGAHFSRTQPEVAVSEVSSSTLLPGATFAVFAVHAQVPVAPECKDNNTFFLVASAVVCVAYDTHPFPSRHGAKYTKHERECASCGWRRLS